MNCGLKILVYRFWFFLLPFYQHTSWWYIYIYIAVIPFSLFSFRARTYFVCLWCGNLIEWNCMLPCSYALRLMFYFFVSFGSGLPPTNQSILSLSLFSTQTNDADWFKWIYKIGSSISTKSLLFRMRGILFLLVWYVLNML